MLRWNGEAELGALGVDGGAENVRVPREPMLPPPPMRASADDATNASGIASDKASARILNEARMRCEEIMVFLHPGMGSGHNMVLLARKESLVRRSGLRLCVAARLRENDYDTFMVSFTAATSWLSVKGFGRNANCSLAGRLFSKASSA